MLRFAIPILVALPLAAQQPPPSPVGFTEARQYRIRGSLQLPGSVESNVVSLVASEIAGLVVEYPVREGDRIEQGQVLARLNKRSLELSLRAALAQLKEADARRKLARRNFERAEELFASNVFSRQQLDDTFYESNALQGRVDNLAAEIDRIKYDIERSTISAPFDGVVTAKHTELGQWLGIGDPVVELLSLDELEVVVNVPEQYYRAIRQGGSASISFEALPGSVVRGKISAVIPRADEQARTFPVKVRIPAQAGRIGVGMLAEVRLDGVSSSGGAARTATIVPKDAIVSQGSEKLVYVMDGDNTVKAVPVTTGAGVGAWIEVDGPVSAGQQVIIRGNERLRPGQQVRGSPVDYQLP